MRVLEKQITVDEFDIFLRQPENHGGLFELIHGEIAKKMPTEEHGQIVASIIIVLGAYLRRYRTGRIGTEVSYRMPKDRYNSREPDLSVSLAKRPLVREGSVSHMPDLAVEVKSPSDSVKQHREKAHYYLANGSQIVWLIFPEQRIVEVYTADEEVEILTERDMLTGGELLPEFQMSVAEIFSDPLDG